VYLLKEKKPVSSIIKKLKRADKFTGTLDFITEPDYEVIGGSTSYGLSTKTSDIDVVGVTTPPIDYIFPHLAGHIPHFGDAAKNFETYQSHHITLKDEPKNEYDVAIYGLVKFVSLAKDNNPNIVDYLFTPERYVLTKTQVGEILRDHRKSFLHKGCFHRFKGYAYSQMRKLERGSNSTGNRKEIIEKHGYDVKFAYHVIRLLDECRQILETHDLVLDSNVRELRAIRNGEWEFDKFKEIFEKRSMSLEETYGNSTLQYKMDEEHAKKILLSCIEAKHGSVEKFFNLKSESESKTVSKYRRIQEIINE
jgi:predicted nucleotidyltransferase